MGSGKDSRSAKNNGTSAKRESLSIPTSKQSTSSTSSSYVSTPKADGKCPLNLPSLLVTKQSYAYIAKEFHSFHQHDVNVLFHLFTTTLGVWGAIQCALHQPYYASFDGLFAVYTYVVLVFLSVPFKTGMLHTIMIAAMTHVPLLQTTSVTHAALAVVAGYILQDVSHYLTVEPTYLGSYITKAPLTLILHTVWLLPLVIDSILLRHYYLPCFVPRNRIIVTTVAAKDAVQAVREWIHRNIAEISETTHIWPHQQEAIDKHVSTLEMDTELLKAFRTVFPETHYDILPVIPMNEVYVTAVGNTSLVNSDKVFYTPHTDGPYWFTPGASLYRVLVGVTPNTLVRTRFNMHYGPQVDRVLDIYQVVGFDYNKELHWIDHTDKPNAERRSLLKLHYIVYPRGWHRYGKLVAKWNITYNTWARNNFLATLRPSTVKEHVMAWWIWLTTWSNALFVMYIGWWNLVYLVASVAVGHVLKNELATVVLTSYRHYALYISVFAYRTPPVAIGNVMRDAKLYKTLALGQLAYRLLPIVDVEKDYPALCVMAAGFATTILATAQLGFIRTYFGSELGFVKPEWVSGFPYSVIPHPMIVGQLIAFGTMIYWFGGCYDDVNRLGVENMALIWAHVVCYTVHMIQEICTSSY